MKRLDFYILKELIVPFLIGFVGLVLLFQADTMIAIYKQYNAANIPFSAVVQIILYRTPEFLKITMPSGVALATSLAMARLVRESELTAMRSAGAPIRRVLLPVLIFGAFVALGQFWIAERIQPIAEARSKTILANALMLGAGPTFVNNIMIPIGPNGRIHVGSAVREGDLVRLSDVTLVEDRPGDETAIIRAKTGTYDKGVWTFPDTTVWTFREKRLIAMSAKQAKIDEKITVSDLFGGGPQLKEMTLADLRTQLDRARQNRVNTVSLELAIHERLALPMACFCFAIAGPALTILFGRSGGFVGVFVSILLVMIYINSYVVSTEILGRNGYMHPAAAAWITNAIFIVFGFWGLRKLE